MRTLVEQPLVRRRLGIDYKKAGKVFSMLDVDGTGALEKEEFIMGCASLSSYASNYDQAPITISMEDSSN